MKLNISGMSSEKISLNKALERLAVAEDGLSRARWWHPDWLAPAIFDVFSCKKEVDRVENRLYELYELWY
jgi:hypothetical protein